MGETEPIADGTIQIDTVINGQLANRNMRVGNEQLEFLYIDLVQLNKPKPDDLRTSIFFIRKRDGRKIEIRIYSEEVDVLVTKQQPVWDLITDGTAEAGAAYDDGS